MATYYVKPAAQGGSNSANGLSASTAWATVAYALSSFSGFASGDTVYIAPGIYTDTISVTMTNPTVETNIIGDPTSSQFSGIAAGPVVITNFNSSLSGSGYIGNLITATTKNYLHFQNIQFKIDNNGAMTLTTCTNLKLTKCSFTSRTSNGNLITITSPSSTAVNFTITKCVFFGANQHLLITGQNVADSSTVIDSVFIRPQNTAAFLNSVQVAWYNCTIIGCQYGILSQPGSVTFPTTVRNSLFLSNINDLICVSVSNAIVENYNRLLSPTPRSNVADNGTSSVVGDGGLDIFETLLQGLTNVQPFTSYLSSPNTNFGNSTGAPVTDIYGVTWTGAKPDAGAGTYRVIASVGPYLPSERNASTITIAPGSTSQSIELYLGVTGLTASTSGLSAYYNRTRSLAVQITPLVALADMTDGWVSGGFKEVNASTMPGVYRLDLPNAALLAGADDVTVVVRGASGTNGAVMTIKLSSGGLTAAQTAQAVLDAVASTHNNIGSIGASIQDKAGYSLSTPQSFSTTGSVGSVTGNVAGNVTGTVGGVVGNVTGNIAGSVATVANPDNIIDGVWDEQRVGHTASGSFGEKLQTNALADEMLARDLGSGLNLGNAEERTVRSALRAIRNKVNVGSSQMVVKREDDTTDAWTASVTTTAVSSNVSGIDPN